MAAQQVVKWTTENAKGDLPAPRSGHTMSVLGQRAVLFGGCGKPAGGKAQAFGDLHILDMSGEEMSWKPLVAESDEAGQSPEPRSRHSATVLDAKTILYFGGLDQRKRFADVWLLEVSGSGKAEWKKVECQVAEGSSAPTPRAHHAVCLVGRDKKNKGKLYLFGGYGGNGKAYNDMYTLDLETYTWEKLNFKGKESPTPRFDCTMVEAQGKIYILGGRDNLQMFQEQYIMDIEETAFPDEPPQAYASNVCNHMCSSIESVPFYKIFAFGGKTGHMEYSNNLQVMDVGNGVWFTPTTEGTPPTPREDATMAYDAKTCRLVFFGGWSNKWFNDIHVLHVSPIIGPPYACLSVEPEIGAVFGGTEVVLGGMDFKESSKIQVKFASGKMEAIVDGEFISDSEIKCVSPNFEQFGAIEVDVRVNISGEGWTVNRVRYNFFSNTSAQFSMAYGPGLIETGLVGVEMPFVIQSRDTTNAKRTSGGDVFSVEAVHEDGVTVSRSRIEDPDTGDYHAFYSVPLEGTYQVNVTYVQIDLGHTHGTHVRGSPFTVVCKPSWKAAKLEGATEAPLMRKGMSASTIGNSVVAFGGLADDTGIQILDTSRDAVFKWTVPDAVGGVPPSERRHHASTVMADGTPRIAIIAGQNKDEDFVPFDDFACLYEPEGSGDDAVWSWKQPNSVKGFLPRPKAAVAAAAEPAPAEEAAEGEEAPAAEGEEAPAADAEGEADADAEEPAEPAAPVEERLPLPSWHTATFSVRNKLYVFGGEADGAILDDLVSIDLSNPEGNGEWIEELIEGEVRPMRRKGHAMMPFSSDKVLMFGGVGLDADDTEVMLEDCYILNLPVDGPISWTKVKPRGQAPTARHGHTMHLHEGKVLLYGGKSVIKDATKEQMYNDVFAWDPEAGSWEVLLNLHYSYLPDTGAHLSVRGKEILLLNSQIGSNKYDLVQRFDPLQSRADFDFKKFMTAKSTEDIDAMSAKMDGFLRDLNTDYSDGEFETLLTVMGALYDVKTERDQLDLAIAQQREVLGALEGLGVNVAKSSENIDKLEVVWEEVKETYPSVKSSVAGPQADKAEEIRGMVMAFSARVAEMRDTFLKRQMWSWDNGVQAGFKEIDEVQKEIVGSWDVEAEKFLDYSNKFEMPELMQEPLETIAECKYDIAMLKDFWEIRDYTMRQFKSWEQTLWSDLDTDFIESGAKGFVKEVRQCDKKMRSEKPYTDFGLYAALEASVKNFLVSVPLVADLRSDAMRDRHWQKLMDATGKKVDVKNPSFKLEDLLALELHKFEEEVGEIVDQAQKEAKMEQSLKKLNETWAKLEFQFQQHKDTSVQLIKMAEEDFEMLEDNQVLVQGMMANRYMKTFEDEIVPWNKKLMNVADVNQLTTEIQRTWAYLEALFIHSEEVKKELPEAADRFKAINTAVLAILAEAQQKKNIVAVCNKDGLIKQMTALQGELELCEKALADYMESKRRAFPRFYFVSATDLLDMLSNGNTPTKVMSHMSKCFQAIDRLELDNPNASGATRPKARAMISCVGTETVQLSSERQLNGKVEEYMNQIVDFMRSDLRDILRKSVKAYPQSARTSWLFDWPSQLILVVSQIFWCQEVEKAFAGMAGDKAAMKKYNQVQVDQLTDLIKCVQGDMSPPDRQKAMNMITMDAHSRDVIENIANDGVDDLTSFQWQSQMRTYWNADLDDAQIKICDAIFPYGYEYLGNGGRLVITPLTDRIYMTATQACWLCLGTAPAGPAGTGKTESTKDLSAGLGKSIYVFNCSPEMDYRTMGDIFKGLAASGSWGCFDEFNRLVPEVLSVCSVQYKCVTDSQKRKSLLPGRGLEYKDGSKVVPAIKDYTFVASDGVTMPLEEGCSAFITMNPGYIGRAELPESLKALFRPITVMVPDRQLIMENMLMAQGFVEAKMLAKKFAALYYLLEDLLSPQKHYDWGLRAINSVLRVAGTLLRSATGQVESDVLFRALRDFNIPKILNDDMPVFMGLLNDLFPGVDPPRNRDMAFEGVIISTAKEMGLTAEDDFVLRVVQFSELLAIRHCIFLMGPTGAGRTECYRVLREAMQKGLDNPSNTYVVANNRKKVTVRDMNPKSITTYELYGYVNLATREWKDGLLSFTMRELANVPDEDPKWMILDGDMDANWIESMNSVMDDNKLLTLPSNERIRVLPHMKLIFEIRDLKFCTPATATRAGILYISEGMQWNNMVQSWIKRVVPPYVTKAKYKDPDVEKPVQWLTELFDKYCPETIFEIKKSFTHVTPLAIMNLVTTLCNILEGLLKPEILGKTSTKENFELYFVFASVWAFGSALAAKDGIDYPRQFDKWWKGKWTTVKLPGKGSVFDYYVNSKTGRFAGWGETVQPITYDSMVTPMSQVFVPTSETASLSFFLDMMVSLQKPIMFCGGSGFGKTQLVRGKLQKLPEGLLSQYIGFNYFSDVVAFQKNLEAQLEKKAGINYGPPGTNQLIYFVDDLNMPMLDAYETSMNIALIRQHLGWGHWFDRAKLNPKNVHNTQYISCMNPTAGSFIIDPRLQRLFATFTMDFPNQESLMNIYSTFLNGHMQHFNADMQELAGKIILAALQLHTKVSNTFRKTAVNFHYEFTVRHLANVFQGLLMAGPSKFNNVNKFSKLWLHESERVYADRLVSNADLEAYNKMAQEAARKNFQIPGMSDFYKKTGATPLVFAHFAAGLEESEYDEINTFDALSKTLTDALNKYNEENATMDLVLFEDAMKHVARISRIISNPQGHALLVGVGGMGKQSLSKLAAYICQYVPYSITISGSYGVSNLKEDIMKMMKMAGKDEGVMWLLTDAQIVNERFMVFLNDLLASGEVPDLFPTEDRDEIIGQMRGEVKGAGLEDTEDNCWQWFVQKIKNNLHVVLTHSPVGDQFRVRANRFPAIVTATVIDWFQPWPETALLSVAKKFLGEVDLGEQKIRDAVVNFMPFSFAAVSKAAIKYQQQEKRFYYATPKTFLELIKLYISLLNNKRTETQTNIDRLTNGLEKLNATQADVDVLVKVVEVKTKEVEAKVKSANAFAEKVGIEKEKVAGESAKADVEKAKCEEIAVEVTAFEANCQKDLAAAEPAVRQAEAALDTLNKKDLGECKSLKKPPSGVDDVTASVIILLSDPGANLKKVDVSWPAAQKMMGNPEKFMETLKDVKPRMDEAFTAGTQPHPFDAAVKYCETKYLPLDHFKVDIIKNKSNAAAGLCDFMINIIVYYNIVSQVEPKRQQLREAQAKLAEANTKLQEVKELVDSLNAQLAQLETDFAAANQEKEDAIAEADRLNTKLGLANRLVNALAASKDVWIETVDHLGKAFTVITGDMLLAAGFVSYVGTFNATFRVELVKTFSDFIKKNSIPASPDSDPTKVLVNDAIVAGWVGDGLPADRTSIENGIIVTNSERWPLLIDPQLQGIVWISEREAKNGLKKVRMGAAVTLKIMEAAIAEGNSVLVENMGETIDAVYNPVVTRSTFRRGRQLYVKMGDKEVEYSDKFKLFLHTKLANPHYPPEIQAELTLVNFTVTASGLEDQLLALVVNKERPDLEQKKTNLIIQNNQYTIQLKEIEDDLLYKLATAEGDITEDVALIESLEEAKRVSDTITLKVKEARETEVVINESREKYRGVANRGSLLFFMLNSINKIHNFYQFSLNAFVVVFARGIDNTPGGRKKPGSKKLSFKSIAKKVMGKFDWNVDLLLSMIPSRKAGAAAPEPEAIPEPTPEELQTRLTNLLATCTSTVYDYTRRGLFDKDKLTVASLLTFQIMRNEGTVDEEEYMCLVNNKKATNPGQPSPELSDWMSEPQWAALSAVAELKAMASVKKDMENSSDLWKEWANNETCEREKMPGDWERVAPFRKLLITRALRPDRICSALEIFVEKTMGTSYVQQPSFDATAMMAEAGTSTPIFFILFAGYSPSKEIEVAAREAGVLETNDLESGKQLKIISMGQGQEPVAEAALDEYTQHGGWVFLDNMHLMKAWVPKLERKLEIAAESGHKDFRCFFSAEPILGAPFADIIPESILQTCIKVSNEPPSDMKSNMRRALSAFNQDLFDRCADESKSTALKAVVFALCFYHSLILGRKKYGIGIGLGAGSGLGFCRGYSFNMGDLATCGEVCFNYINANDKTPWADLRFMCGEVFYGGHITDPMDRRLCIMYLNGLLKPDLIPVDGKPPEFELAPKFRAPLPTDLQTLRDYVEIELPAESPVLYGLHPNADLALMTSLGEGLFETVVDIGGGGGGAAEAGAAKGGGGGGGLSAVVDDLLAKCPEPFNMVEVNSRAADKTPFVICALQEATRMNGLVVEIKRSLEELLLGLAGSLNMSDKMTALQTALERKGVPSSWMGMMSTRVQEVYSLSQWYADVKSRYLQLVDWLGYDVKSLPDFKVKRQEILQPKSIWMPGLFNAKAIVTAVQQIYARKNSLPLDVMKFKTEVTKFTSFEEVPGPAEEGVFIHGLVMEGARWDLKTGLLADSNPSELHPDMPVMVIVPVHVDQYNIDGYYPCPVYMNMQRANVYSAMVGVFTLKTDKPITKWVLASAAMLMQDELK